MEKSSKNGGKGGMVTPSTALLNRKLGTSPTPRMLTPSEVALLKRSKQEISEWLKKTANNKRA